VIVVEYANDQPFAACHDFNYHCGVCRLECAPVSSVPRLNPDLAGFSRDTGTHNFAPHDCFVIPPWQAHRFTARSDCMLFSFPDRAAQGALDFWREAADGLSRLRRKMNRRIAGGSTSSPRTA